MIVKGLFLAALSAMSALVQGYPGQERSLSERQSTDRLVFAHFMIGITSDRSSSADYDADMQRAKSYGIDAFALNIGVDPYTDQQLGFAYDSAARNGMKVFISFDFNWWNTGQATAIGQKIAQYAGLPGQLKVDGKVFVSSFAGDGVNIGAMRSAAGVELFFAPNFHPSYGTDMSNVDGLLNWMGWPSNGNNKAPTSGATVSVEQGDNDYISALAGKAYIAPASPWFSTHFGPEVSYSKNWVFPSDLLWYNRWQELLKLGPRFIEIVTWNDYGESHYIGPLSSPHTDDGASKWVNDMPHDGWLDMAKPFIAAFKAGATTVDNYITNDELVYWYRPTLKNVNCDATDTCMNPSASNSSGNYFLGRPNGYETMQDSVFVVSLLTAPAQVTVTSGGNSQTFQASAGANAFQVPMGVGSQTFSVTRNGATVFQGTSLKQIINGCVCGLYNFNAYVGTLPAGFSDPLGPAGLASLVQGLHVATCAATPSLGTAPPVVTAPPVPATTTTTIITTKTTTTSTSTSTSGTCIAGTGPGNYVGLCSFCCNFGYCPPGPCTCTAYGAPVPTPPVTGTVGLPLYNEDNSYLGLCSFACNHGYCPNTACRVA
ncbi:hypothetical protein TMatcc_000870 [Talaromyces marneffei ATCC 18224]|uniref:Alpha-1,3-glucanase/mutanase, putative n=1 Tax=Talaromyces marneffei (strain ATCC 18224 / CBS 334.59 / QM 7333) TaxID=441960 RepID=B6QS75_TALMQ|nr:alpha-1,3-glucanase/mutanase, putative [Talaromyces marneffei ATCC 18224]KAE8549828.1 hypothetical protein EYB25_008352 [Talaromyces marneffei]